MICALHGFLGEPSDWDILPFPHRAPALLEDVGGTIEQAASRVLERVSPGDSVLGYSMGGRVALHALLADAATAHPKVARAVIVAAGLGIRDEHERAKRRERDVEWARRFETHQWARVMREWNAQPVFGGHEVTRAEESFDRTALAAALVRWSPGEHAYLLPLLPRIRAKVLWVVGAEDAAYVAVARTAFAALPHAELAIIEGAGHRVPWQQTAAFVSIVSRFLEADAGLP